jgi:hypothetical protein
MARGDGAAALDHHGVCDDAEAGHGGGGLYAEDAHPEVSPSRG